MMRPPVSLLDMASPLPGRIGTGPVIDRNYFLP